MVGDRPAHRRRILSPPRVVEGHHLPRRTTWATTTRSRTRPTTCAGKAKEKLGDATDNESLQNEGKKDQSKADLKQAGEKVKDAFKN